MKAYRPLSIFAVVTVSLAAIVAAWLWYLGSGLGGILAQGDMCQALAWVGIAYTRRALGRAPPQPKMWRSRYDSDTRRAINAPAVVMAMGALAATGTMGVIIFGTILAHQLGLIGHEATSLVAARGANVVFGLMAAVLGNAFPKTVFPLSPSVAGEATAQAYKRFVGWTYVLGGLAYAGVWLIAPLPLSAAMLGMAILLTAGLLPVLYTFWLGRKLRHS
jgi:hypothetical protein